MDTFPHLDIIPYLVVNLFVYILYCTVSSRLNKYVEFDSSRNQGSFKLSPDTETFTQIYSQIQRPLLRYIVRYRDLYSDIQLDTGSFTQIYSQVQGLLLRYIVRYRVLYSDIQLDTGSFTQIHSQIRALAPYFDKQLITRPLIDISLFIQLSGQPITK